MGCAVSVTLRPLFAPGARTPVPIVQEAGWAQELVWTQTLEKKPFASGEDRIPVIRPVVRHCNA
jgi:hypothetical protein